MDRTTAVASKPGAALGPTNLIAYPSDTRELRIIRTFNQEGPRRSTPPTSYFSPHIRHKIYIYIYDSKKGYDVLLFVYLLYHTQQ